MSETARAESQTTPLDSQVLELADQWRESWFSTESGPRTGNTIVPSWLPGDAQAAMYSELQARDKLVTHMAIRMMLTSDHYENTASIIHDSLRMALPGRLFADLAPGLLRDTWSRTIELIRTQEAVPR